MTVIASFSIDYHRLLDEQGELLGNLPSTVDNNRLLALYQAMVELRIFDQKAIALQRTGKMGTYASTLGQEAISTAVGLAMRPEDLLVPFYRDYGAMLARGVTMAEIYRYWGGNECGSDFQHDRNDYPICVPIASQCLHACGSAFAYKYRNEKRVVCVGIGDGGTSEGDFYEALNVAGEWQLPVVFVINNNQWAISVPRSAQTAAQTLAQKAIAAGIPGVQVDGNDFIAVLDQISQAVDRARQGGGPTLIEAMTYRLCDHTTADDATRYRPNNELTEAEKKEPLIRAKRYLEAQGLWNDQLENDWQERCKQKVAEAVDEYLTTPPQPVTAMFDYHYQTLPTALTAQRDEAVYFFQQKEGKNA